MGRRVFLERAGASAEGVVFPLLYSRKSGSGTFAETFKARFGVSPDYAAAYSYDSVCLLVAAVRKAGLNRVRICDEVRGLAPWQGVTGRMCWDGQGRNATMVRVGCVESGRIVALLQDEPSLGDLDD